MGMQGAGAIELVPWPHADQAHEWSQSIQSDFSLDIQVAWTRLSDVSHLHYHTEVMLIRPYCLFSVTENYKQINGNGENFTSFFLPGTEFASSASRA